MITVANVRTTKNGVYIGRAMPRQGWKGSHLGNPYRLDGLERGVVIRMYREWLERALETNTPQLTELSRLTELARHGDLTLLCWCAPLACHGDVVKELIEARLEA